MRVHLCILAVICGVIGASAANLPSYFTACSESDPNLDHCIEDVIRAGGPQFADGIPELGIAPLDPLQLGKVVVNNPSLKLTFTDTVVTGLRGFRVNAFKMQAAKGKAMIDFTANVTLKAHYDIDGQVIILPIRGNGPAKIRITNLNIVIKYDFDTQDGHWVVTNYKDTYKMDRAQFKFSNLFGGNKQLAETTHRFTNENWEIIMSEIAPGAIKGIIKSCVDVVNKFFSVVPAADMFSS
ncbi:circadian clock-controlled protein daywake-like isoform X1 [Plodia interpunctella]|uniref:circadian clock-controlled protein daywake-like isoform X1 n=1 Tax=Plodia interpunctella TaxID=58824 RepID=UPI0023681E59|nr:circadian clock-controlled protein daywake-like isoform X1 [Plodia interpunctella]XP_053604579.1 circadian clock-controlled protein daywake-like isoform X1 [Plodia interpunctella]